MKTYEKEIQRKLCNVELTKLELSNYVEKEIITEEDIINLFRKDVNYGVRMYGYSSDPKKQMLKNIFNCPFLLCDQAWLSLRLKNLLPYFLNARYNIEKDNLDLCFTQGFIDKNEYNYEINKLNFFYYEMSKDGKSILETGHAFFGSQKTKSL